MTNATPGRPMATLAGSVAPATHEVPGMKGERLGEFEELVLLATYGLDEGHEAYGVSIQQRLEETIDRSATLGAVYSALDRLERKGYLTSRVGGATGERGGRRKRLFEITPDGVEALEEMRRDREAMWRRVGPAGPARP